MAIGQITLEIVLEQCNFELISHEEDPDEILKQNQERKIKTNSQSESNQFANQQKEKFSIGHLSNSTINQQQASIRNNNSNNRDINRQILDKKCLNPQCTNKDGKKSLLHCTGKLLILFY